MDSRFPNCPRPTKQVGASLLIAALITSGIWFVAVFANPGSKSYLFGTGSTTCQNCTNTTTNITINSTKNVPITAPPLISATCNRSTVFWGDSHSEVIKEVIVNVMYVDAYAYAACISHGWLSLIQPNMTGGAMLTRMAVGMTGPFSVGNFSIMNGSVAIIGSVQYVYNNGYSTYGLTILLDAVSGKIPFSAITALNNSKSYPFTLGGIQIVNYRSVEYRIAPLRLLDGSYYDYPINLPPAITVIGQSSLTGVQKVAFGVGYLKNSNYGEIAAHNWYLQINGNLTDLQSNTVSWSDSGVDVILDSFDGESGYVAILRYLSFQDSLGDWYTVDFIGEVVGGALSLVNIAAPNVTGMYELSISTFYVASPDGYATITMLNGQGLTTLLIPET